MTAWPPTRPSKCWKRRKKTGEGSQHASALRERESVLNFCLEVPGMDAMSASKGCRTEEEGDCQRRERRNWEGIKEKK